MKSLYVTVTAGCEDLGNRVFPRGSEWEINDIEFQDNGNIVVAFSWNGDMQTAIERHLDQDQDVISYQII